MAFLSFDAVVFKNSLATSGYIIAIAGGGYGIHYLSQDKTIGDLLIRLGKVHTESEDFKKAYQLLKNNTQFNIDIKASSLKLTSTNESDFWKLLKNWCDEKSALPLTEENIKEVLPKAQNYCIFTKQDVVENGQTNKSSLSWRNVKRRISNKGISEKGQVFVSFVDNTAGQRGRQKTHSYCWDTKKNDWIDSTGAEDCRKYVKS